ncbi:MAG: hypothetical protein HKM89_07570 [Gemmatimonadales bacterium]|nr:hypothetical protein [Gemmatimonadales bacterium]
MSAHQAAKQGLENLRRSAKMRAMRHRFIFVSVSILSACATASVTPPNRAEVVRPPTPFAHPDLVESSGVAVSQRHPGVLWTHNDSGNEPLLFATDTLGRDFGATVVLGAENLDWEDLAIGPCGSTVCLYVGDTGDNREVRPSVTLYRVREPALGAASTEPAEQLELRYPDGAHDAEAMYVDARGDLYLITKGRSRGVLLYRVRQEAWASGVTLAEALGSLPIDPQGTVFNMVTGADIDSGDGLVVLRTYREIYIFSRAPDGTMASRVPLKVCDIAGLESQGEGIAWLDDTRLILTSEEGNLGPGTVTILNCPDP